MALESLPDLFSKRKKSDEKERREKEERLLRQIGKLSVEVDWLKKNLMNTVSTIEERKRMLVKDLRDLSLSRQCELLNLAFSTAYYKVRVNEAHWLKTIDLMNRIDEVSLLFKITL